MSQKISQKGNALVVAIIIIVVVLLGAVWYKKQISYRTAGVGTQSTSGQTGAPTQTLNDGMDKDTQNLDAQMNTLGSDSSNLDQSLKETPTSDLTQ